ncbi:metallo-beta-lactamase superfamily protein [Hyaloscypha variabilis F]|jgi:glyoxylase-like metal-dependent hydrolase (beta-lactamase superfamily II)|uniref:Metallo-beta-lactamase superfamily protein n=1 Tax=Hyaloscypha variabilis (strain UAMH 11265 / GT02V1 / F) TaxID=1149755 RepID=A0A2J6QRT2_HYAVF|nr:metallo-beta-lactamase superfamily protein [Hyaloscypha variabilis F]
MGHTHHKVAGAAPAVSSVGAKYVEPSVTRILQKGEKINDLFNRNVTTPYFVQRLSERAYFFNGGFYTTTFYVGETGVLLLDAPEGQAKNILEAIAEVTNLPVTTIVYSHNHADHIISAAEVIEASKAAGVKEVRIIASKKTAEKMVFLQCKLPAPTETIAWPKATFKFDNVTVQFDGFERAAHCDDAGTFLLVEEKVVHLPDLMNGDQPPFWRFGTAENTVYYRSNITQLGDLDWIHHVGGHGNVGGKEDIAFVKQYLDDLDIAVAEGMKTVKFGGVENINEFNNHAALMVPWLSSLSKHVVDLLRPKYGQFYGFEFSGPSHAEMVALSAISYR